MRRLLILISVFFITTSCHPINQEEKPPAECCPCPKNSTEHPEVRDSMTDSSNVARSVVRPDEIGLCPCGIRSADSMGSASEHIPVIGLKPVLRELFDPKEEPKNLLQPEVGLASSVLETIRDATEEEYRDAVARDAARNAIRLNIEEPEVIKNIVTIVLNPADEETKNSEDELLAGATHYHESRCTSPLGMARSRTIESVQPVSGILRDVLGLPSEIKMKTALPDQDIKTTASNINENVLESSSQNDDVLDLTTETFRKANLGNNNKIFKGFAKTPLLKGIINGNTQETEPVNEELRQDGFLSASNVSPLLATPKKLISIFKERVENEALLDNIPKLKSNSISPKDIFGEKEITIKLPFLKVPTFNNDQHTESSKASDSLWKIPSLADLFKKAIKIPIETVTTANNVEFTATTTDSDDNIDDKKPFKTQIIDTLPTKLTFNTYEEKPVLINENMGLTDNPSSLDRKDGSESSEEIEIPSLDSLLSQTIVTESSLYEDSSLSQSRYGKNRFDLNENLSIGTKKDGEILKNAMDVTTIKEEKEIDEPDVTIRPYKILPKVQKMAESVLSILSKSVPTDTNFSPSESNPHVIEQQKSVSDNKPTIKDLLGANSEDNSDSLPITRVFNKSQLGQQPIVQPEPTKTFESLFDNSFLPQLPTLEELGSRLQSVLDNSILTNTVASPAKTLLNSNIQDAKTNDELDLNLFRSVGHDSSLNPKKSGPKQESFAARVRIPVKVKKPLNFQSTIGKDGNIFGARLVSSPKSQSRKHNSRFLDDTKLRDTLRASINIPKNDINKNIKSKTNEVKEIFKTSASKNTPITLNGLENMRTNLITSSMDSENNFQKGVIDTIQDSKLRINDLLSSSNINLLKTDDSEKTPRILGELPSVHELTSNIQNRAQEILKSSASINAPERLDSLEKMRANLKSSSMDAVNDFQRSLSDTIQNNKLKINDVLSSSNINLLNTDVSEKASRILGELPTVHEFTSNIPNRAQEILKSSPSINAPKRLDSLEKMRANLKSSSMDAVNDFQRSVSDTIQESKSRLNDVLSTSNINLLNTDVSDKTSRILGELPSVHELTSNIQNRAQEIFKSSASINAPTRLDGLDKITANLKSSSMDAVNDFQKSVSDTIQNSKLRVNDVLSSSNFNLLNPDVGDKPSKILEKLPRVHELTSNIQNRAQKIINNIQLPSLEETLPINSLDRINKLKTNIRTDSGDVIEKVHKSLTGVISTPKNNVATSSFAQKIPNFMKKPDNNFPKSPAKLFKDSENNKIQHGKNNLQTKPRLFLGSEKLASPKHNTVEYAKPVPHFHTMDIINKVQDTLSSVLESTNAGRNINERPLSPVKGISSETMPKTMNPEILSAKPKTTSFNVKSANIPKILEPVKTNSKTIDQLRTIKVPDLSKASLPKLSPRKVLKILKGDNNSRKSVPQKTGSHPVFSMKQNTVSDSSISRPKFLQKTPDKLTQTRLSSSNRGSNDKPTLFSNKPTKPKIQIPARKPLKAQLSKTSKEPLKSYRYSAPRTKSYSGRDSINSPSEPVPASFQPESNNLDKRNKNIASRLKERIRMSKIPSTTQTESKVLKSTGNTKEPVVNDPVSRPFNKKGSVQDLASINRKIPTDILRSSNNPLNNNVRPDMLNQAAETIKKTITPAKSMRENVAYNCRMVCTEEN